MVSLCSRFVCSAAVMDGMHIPEVYSQCSPLKVPFLCLSVSTGDWVSSVWFTLHKGASNAEGERMQGWGRGNKGPTSNINSQQGELKLDQATACCQTVGETQGSFKGGILLLLLYVPNVGWPSATWCPCPWHWAWTRWSLIWVPSKPNLYDPGFQSPLLMMG